MKIQKKIIFLGGEGGGGGVMVDVNSPEQGLRNFQMSIDPRL